MLNSKSSMYEKLKKSASSTANSRFNACRRLDFLDKSSNLALIVSSSSLIITSITIELLKNKVTFDSYISIGQLCIPILLLVLSILISSCKYGVRAEKMHECAQKLNHCSKLFEYKVAEKNSNPEFTMDEYIEYKSFCESYASILKGYDNHCDIDRTAQKIKDCLKKCILTSPFKDLVAFIFNISLIGYFYISINILSVYWAWIILQHI
ncbi:SLATT domain-containing protein [Klebsiella aerogenes]|nr:SLATT domain-containing protein [Klebsiella aerogenes]